MCRLLLGVHFILVQVRDAEADERSVVRVFMEDDLGLDVFLLLKNLRTPHPSLQSGTRGEKTLADQSLSSALGFRIFRVFFLFLLARLGGRGEGEDLLIFAILGFEEGQIDDVNGDASQSDEMLFSRKQTS